MDFKETVVNLLFMRKKTEKNYSFFFHWKRKYIGENVFLTEMVRELLFRLSIV